MLPKWVVSLGRHDGRTPQAEPSQASGKGPRRRDLAKPKRDRRRRAERGPHRFYASDRPERHELERQRDPVVQVENERNGDPEPLEELGRPARRGLPARNSVRADRWFGGQGRKAGCQLVDKPLVRISSNVHSKPCPRGPTFTAEPAWGAIPGAVPGDRTVPQGRRRRTQRRIDDHEQSRWAVRRSTDNRLLRALRCPPPDPRAPSAPSPRRGMLPIPGTKDCARRRHAWGCTTHVDREANRLARAALRSVLRREVDVADWIPTRPNGGLNIPEASPVSTEWATVDTISGSCRRHRHVPRAIPADEEVAVAERVGWRRTSSGTAAG